MIRLLLQDKVFLLALQLPLTYVVLALTVNIMLAEQARNMGAIVRVFDTRAAVAEQASPGGASAA